MKYIITKTSYSDDDYARLHNGSPDWASDPSPHPDAVQFHFEYWDLRTFKTPEEHDAKLGYLGNRWQDRGTQHTTWSGGIKRRLSDTVLWVLDIPDLTTFVKVHGRIVLSPPDTERHGPNALFEVEIYNTYRE